MIFINPIYVLLGRFISEYKHNLYVEFPSGKPKIEVPATGI